MRRNLNSFYGGFYGEEFARILRNIAEFQKRPISYTITSPKQLILNLKDYGGKHASYIHTYDHITRQNIKKEDRNMILYDRLFIDFDSPDPELSKVKKEIKKLRSHSLYYKHDKQVKLRNKLQKMIIREKKAQEPIMECKRFAEEFEEAFGKPPALFFSGGRGCHLYSFFKHREYHDFDRSIEWFVTGQKEAGEYPSIDLSVVKRATTRLSRVPYSEHQLTGLHVVPFEIGDKYEDIMETVLNPTPNGFKKRRHMSKFDKHLREIDKRLKEREELTKKTKNKPHPAKIKYRERGSPIDHREFFKALIGEPVREYAGKEYVMYNCPFQDHDDEHPSFKVHKTGGYECYGCGRKGNYYDFLKEFYGYSNKQIRKYMRKNFYP